MIILYLYYTPLVFLFQVGSLSAGLSAIALAKADKFFQKKEPNSGSIKVNDNLLGSSHYIQ
jgi:hypothetical protein